MAISGKTYSKTQWRLALQGETTIGTANTTTMQLFNIQDTPTWDRGAIRSMPLRSGIGRFKKEDDVNFIEENQLKTCTFNCLVGTDEMAILLENHYGNEAGLTPAGFAFETGYTDGAAGEMLQGGSPVGTYDTLTAALIPPEDNQTELATACVISNLVIRGDLTANDTLVECSVTLVTKNKLAVNQATPGSMVAYTAGDDVYKVFDFGGSCQLNSADVIMSGFEITSSNGVGFVGGACDADGNPQVIVRGLTDPMVQCALTVKYDDNTEDLPQTSKDQSLPIPVQFGNNATWTAATVGFKGTSGWIVDNPEMTDVEGAMFFTINLEYVDDGTNDIFEVVA